MGQARIAPRAGVSFMRVTLLHAVWWLLSSEAAARMHRMGLESLSFGRALKRSKHFQFHPFLSTRGTILARIAKSCGQVMPQPPSPGGSRYHRPTCDRATRAILRDTAAMAHRLSLVFISLTLQALRLDQMMERISMAFAAA